MSRRPACLSIARLLGRRLLRSESGVTAVEFAIVGPVFLALIAATIETALVFFAGAALENAVLQSSRLLRTGQVQYVNSYSNYKSALCGQLYNIFDCDEVRVAVRKLDGFGDFAMAQPIDTETGAWIFDEGPWPPLSGSDVVMVEAYYKWPTFFNIPGLSIGLTADGRRLLAGTHVFKNEPF